MNKHQLKSGMHFSLICFVWKQRLERWTSCSYQYDLIMLALNK